MIKILNYEFKDSDVVIKLLSNFITNNPKLEKKCNQIVEKENNKNKFKTGHDCIKFRYKTFKDLIQEFFKNKELISANNKDLNATSEERNLYISLCDWYIDYDFQNL